MPASDGRMAKHRHVASVLLPTNASRQLQHQEAWCTASAQTYRRGHSERPADDENVRERETRPPSVLISEWALTSITVPYKTLSFRCAG